MKKISHNPYIVGNPIKTKEMFFGREDDFLFIARKIGLDKANQVIILCGERRSGKTSVLFQILAGRLGTSFLPVLVDMQILAGIKSDFDFFKAILETGCDQLKIAELSFPVIQERVQGRNVERMFDEFLASVNRIHPDQVVLFLLDEYELLEAKIKEGTLSESVVHYFSGMLEGSHRISFIFTGSTNLENRKVDFWKALLGKSIYRKISYLSENDTQRLITEPLAGSIDYPEEVVTSIYRLTGGQPFYVQVVCQNLVDLLIEGDRNDPDSGDLENVVRDIVENPLPQMIYSWNSLSDWTKFALSALAGGLESGLARCDGNGVYHFLQKSKIMLPFKRERLNVFLEEAYQKELLQKSEQDEYSFRMDLYRRWIRKEHSIWKVIKEVNLEVKKRRGWVKYLIAGAAALAVAAVMLVIFLSREGEKNSRIMVEANQAPFRVVVDGGQPLTSEGQKDTKSIRLPPLTLGPHRLVMTNTVTGEKVEMEVVVEESTREFRVLFSQDVAEHTFGSLFLSTTPEGSLIYINDVDYGVTPKVVGGLAVGAYTVVLVHEGFKSEVRSLEVKENVINQQKIALTPVFGALVLDIRPTAKVFLDGNYLVDTPYAQPLSVQAGNHTLLVVNESLGVKEEIPVIVKENEQARIERTYK